MAADGPDVAPLRVSCHPGIHALLIGARQHEPRVLEVVGQVAAPARGDQAARGQVSQHVSEFRGDNQYPGAGSQQHADSQRGSGAAADYDHEPARQAHGDP